MYSAFEPPFDGILLSDAYCPSKHGQDLDELVTSLLGPDQVKPRLVRSGPEYHLISKNKNSPTKMHVNGRIRDSLIEARST